MDKIQKTKIIKSHALAAGDTGSAEVQIALLSARIEELQDHFKKNPKDKHSDKGLVAMVNERKKHLQYLMKNQPKRYKDIVKKLKLKEKKEKK